LAQFKAAAATTGNDPAIESAFKTWAARASRLRQRLEQAKEQRIPELLLLREKEWFDAVKSMNQLDTDEDFRRLSACAKYRQGRIRPSAAKRRCAATQTPIMDSCRGTFRN